LWRIQLDGCLAEHGADRLAQRLRAVDHEQHPLLGIEATLDQIGQQRGRDGRVLGRALPEPERDLHPLGRDPERDDVRSALQLDPIQHQHRQPDIVQATGHQLAERPPGALDERARDGRLRCRARSPLDPLADWLLSPPVTAGRDTGQHPL
jgi:hypothetical protein